jgi:anti-sigma factor RsiW
MLRVTVGEAMVLISGVVDLSVNQIYASCSLLATHLLDVPSIDQHTVKPWFDRKLKFSPPVQDFTDRGFRLIGGRLDYLAGPEVAAVVYQRKKE